MDSKTKKRLVFDYYAFQFFFTLLIWTPIFFEFHKRIGLSESEIFKIQSIYYIVFCIAEIPTGLFADRFGYLKSMKLGAILLILSNALPIFAPNYSGILWHWLLLASARSFISGASAAYLYEFLRRFGLAEEFKGIEGKARAVSLYGRIFGFAGVGVLMNWNLYAPYAITIVTAAISLGFAYRLPKLVEASAETESSTRIRDSRVSLTQGALLVARAPRLIFLIFQGVVIFVLARIIQVNLYQPILQLKEFKVGVYGVIMGGMILAEALGSSNPGWMRKYAKDVNAVFVLSVIMGLSTFLIPYMGQWGTLALFAVFSIATGLSYPIQKQLMNDAVPDPKYRATILSIESIVDRAFSAGVVATLEKVSRNESDIGNLLGMTFFNARSPIEKFIIASGGASVIAMIALWILPKAAGYHRSEKSVQIANRK